MDHHGGLWMRTRYANETPESILSEGAGGESAWYAVQKQVLLGGSIPGISSE